MAHISPPHPFLKNISQELKALNSAEDLIELGITGSAKTLANKRYDGSGPDFIRLKGTGIRYPKNSVLDWLRRSAVFVKQGGQTMGGKL